MCQRETHRSPTGGGDGCCLASLLRDAPCSNAHFLLPDRNHGRPQGYPWTKIEENILSRSTDAAVRLTFRANLSYLKFAGSHMARIASWCERELAACYSCRKAGLSHSFRSLIESCRAWLLPEGQKGQRCGAPWLEWMSQSLSVLCWLEEHTLDTRGNNRRRLLASRSSKYLPERVRTGIRDGRVQPDALAATAEWLTRQLLGPLVQARHDEGHRVRSLLWPFC